MNSLLADLVLGGGGGAGTYAGEPPCGGRNGGGIVFVHAECVTTPEGFTIDVSGSANDGAFLNGPVTTS